MFTIRSLRWGLAGLTLLLAACGAPGAEYERPRDVLYASTLFRVTNGPCLEEARVCTAVVDQYSRPYTQVVADALGLEDAKWQDSTDYLGLGEQAYLLELKHVNVHVWPSRLDFAYIRVNLR